MSSAIPRRMDQRHLPQQSISSISGASNCQIPNLNSNLQPQSRCNRPTTCMARKDVENQPSMTYAVPNLPTLHDLIFKKKQDERPGGGGDSNFTMTPSNNSGISRGAHDLSKNNANANSVIAIGGNIPNIRPTVPTTDESRPAKDLVKNFVRIAKVGIAVAIIKSAPAGVNGEEYARRLCGAYQRAQLEYKQRSSQLQREVLSLRQQLLMAQVSGSGGGASQEGEGQTGLKRDDSRFLQKTREEIADEIMGHTLPPSPSPTLMEQETLEVATLSHNMNFLRKYISLRTLSTLPVSVKKEEWEKMARTTILQTLEILTASLTETVTDVPPISTNLVSHSVVTIATLIDKGVCWGYVGEVAERAGHLTNTILLCILQSKAINQAKHHRHLRHLVVELGRCIHLRHGIISLIVHYVTNYSHHLRLVTSAKTAFLPWTYEDMYHILWCLEEIIKIDKDGTGGVLVAEFRTKVKEELENSLLHITEKFPLFSMYIWHLCALLN